MIRDAPPAVILDRDGVINEDSDAFIKSLDEWHPIPGSIEAIVQLSRAGWIVAVCTNQSGIARALMPPEAVQAMHARLLHLVREQGGNIHGIYVCPHGPDDNCACRKPRPGLLLQAAGELGFSLEGIPVIGDAQRDIDAARSVVARPILVKTGKGCRTLAADHHHLPASDIHDNLATATCALIAELSESPRGSKQQ